MSIAEQALWDKKGGVTMNQKSMLTAQDLLSVFAAASKFLALRLLLCYNQAVLI